MNVFDFNRPAPRMPSKLQETWERFRNGPLAGNGISLKAADKNGEAEVLIYGTIGQDFWGEGNSAKDVLKEISALKADRMRVRVNSPGGDVFDGMAMYTAIKGFKGEKIVQIDGLAASAAAVLAMAGDRVEISAAAMMMIHDAWGLVLGNAQDALEFSAVLEKIDGQIAGVFSAKTRKPADEIRRLMDAETWYTAEEAVAFGLADALLADKASEEPAKAAAKAAHSPAAAAAARIRLQELDSEALAG